MNQELVNDTVSATYAAYLFRPCVTKPESVFCANALTKNQSAFAELAPAWFHYWFRLPRCNKDSTECTEKWDRNNSHTA